MSEFVTVDIPQGRLRGKTVTSSSNGVTYYSFQGIPYAKPPVGPLRFKAPEDPEPWTETRDATIEGAVSPQFDILTLKLVGDDDCLFLNVYTPQWPAKTPKAVMVWIHGGAFILGSGNTDMYGPDFLVAEDVILVTINYRLGAMGFLHMDNTDTTGNNGLRDQVMALKWVKNNIAHFGGDPGNVTIFGESAGGSSVHFLVLSPLARGLFHRAIAQSGTALLFSKSLTSEKISQRALRLAKFFGCTSDNPQEVANFLRYVPAEKFIIHQGEALSAEERGGDLVFPFVPSEESGPQSFLPGPAMKLLEEGQFTKVPFMTGVTSAEGKIFLVDVFSRTKFTDIHQKLDNVLSMDIYHNKDKGKRKEMCNIVEKFYFGDKNFGDEPITEYIDMMTDLLFVYPAHLTIQSQLRWSPHSTYIYLFDHLSPPDIKLLPTAGDDLSGAPHGAELPYLFQSSFRPNSFPPGSAEAQLLATFTKLWTQFAKTGNPSNEAANVFWSPARIAKLSYLKINGGFNMEMNLYKHRMDFLGELCSKL